MLNLELATVSDEKVTAKRRADEMEAKLTVASQARSEAGLAAEKKEYLEGKVGGVMLRLFPVTHKSM